MGGVEESKRACGREIAEKDGEGGRATDETAKCQFSSIKQTYMKKRD